MIIEMKWFNLNNKTYTVKEQWRKLSKRLHPDTSGYDSSSDFKEMNEEYKEISTNGHNYYIVNNNYEDIVERKKYIYPNIRREPGIDFKIKKSIHIGYLMDGTKVEYKRNKTPTMIIDQIINFAILKKLDKDWVIHTVIIEVSELNFGLVSYMAEGIGLTKQNILKVIKRYR